MDGFTASCLLDAASKPGANHDEIADLYKTLKKDEGGATKEATEFVEKNLGSSCKVLHTCYTGVIEGLNNSIFGFYPGSRFPVYVKITSSSDPEFERAVGSIF